MMQIPFIGQKMVILDRCDSTNSELTRMCTEEHAMSGTVVLAYTQLAGRGQRGNLWESKSGKDLTFSFLLSNAGIKAEDAFLSAMATALALKNWFMKILPSEKEIEIKWPNDVLCQRKKIAGILIEHAFSGDRITRSVIGVGINLGTESFGETRFPATSVILECGKTVSPVEGLSGLMPFLNEYFQKIEQNPKGIQGEYIAALYAGRKAESAIIKGAKKKVRIVSVNRSGIPTIQMEDGLTEVGGTEELQFIP
jgi:BirA family biotin operon repressor/biotin-[acetyl-CoA-carboxylase] ligase